MGSYCPWTRRACPLGKAIDIGCGDGAISQLLAPQAMEYVCLDYSEKMLTAARKRLARNATVKYQLADFHALPFGSEAFDTALMFNVLTSAERPQDALSEAARVLKPKGRLALIALDAHQHRDITDAYHHTKPGFSVKTLKSLLKAASFEIDFCDVTSRERRDPHFQVITVFAHRSAQ